MDAIKNPPRLGGGQNRDDKRSWSIASYVSSYYTKFGEVGGEK